jgi:signal transduction histidine kinase
MSIRLRVALTTAVIVAATLAAGDWGLHTLYKSRLAHDFRHAAQTDAAGVGSASNAGSVPMQLTATVPFTLIQVIDSTGQVIAASPGIDPQIALIPQRLLGRAGGVEISQVTYGHTRHRVHLEVVPVVVSGRHLNVVVVLSMADIERAESVLALGLREGLPLLGVLVALLAWAGVGEALRPVEAMRRQAADITGRDLHKRISTPSGRDEIAALANTLNELLDRLDKATNEQRRFVSDASHELRSPLSGIMSALDVALLAEPPGERRRLLERLLRESGRLESVLDQLLTLTHGDEHAPLNLRPVNVSDLVIAEAGRPTPAGISLTSDVSVGLTVDGDPDLLTRVVRNLLSNAMRHAASSVLVDLAADGDVVRLTVRDDGPGVPAEAREKIFGRFVRIDDHRSRSRGGTGLGLAIAHDAVLAHGGRIRVVDTDNAGATFMVEIPRRGVVPATNTLACY